MQEMYRCYADEYKRTYRRQVSNNDKLYLTHDTIASGKYFHVHRAAVFHGSKLMRTDQGVHHSYCFEPTL